MSISKNFCNNDYNTFQKVIASVNDLINTYETPSIQNILKVIAKFAAADRSYIFKNTEDKSGAPYCVKLFESIQKDVTHQIDNEELQKFYYAENELQWLYEGLNSGRSVAKHSSELSEEERAILYEQDIMSILITPIFINKTFWGFIGFDDCSKERNWSHEEELILISVGTLLGTHITKLESEQKLGDKKNFFKTILETSFEGMTVLSKNKKIKYQSSSNQKVIGYTNKEHRDLDIFSLIHPEDLPLALNTFEFLLENPNVPKQIELKYRHKDGHYMDLEMYVINLLEKEEVRGIVVNFRDITYCKYFKEKLQKSEVHLKDAQTLGKVGSWTIDFITGAQEWSDEVYNTYGMKKGDVIPSLELFISIIHPDDQEYVIKEIQRSEETSSDIALNFRIKRQDGEVRHLYSKTQFLFDKNGVPIGIFGTQQDISDLKEYEDALINSEKKYKKIFDLSPIPMWIYNTMDYKFIDVNEAAIAHYGYSKEEFLSLTIKDIRPASEINKLVKNVEDAVGSDKISQGIYKHQKKNGEIIYVDVSGSALDVNDNKHRLVLAHDITTSVKHIQIIEKQNKKLIEIAWIQSHVVRAPLARLMGLVHILQDNDGRVENKFVLKNILTSANELDKIIKDIVNRSAEVERTMDTLNGSNSRQEFITIQNHSY